MEARAFFVLLAGPVRRRIFAWCLLSAAVLFAALGVEAKIGAAYQMLLGNPSNAVTDPAVKNNYLLLRDQHAISYNDSLGVPNWVSWNLTQEDRGTSGRSSVFFEDPDLPAGFYRVQPWDYNDSGYSRGHMCPSGDRTVTRADNDVTFYMTNMIPQTSHNNAGVWEKFESECRALAAAGNEVLVITGPSHFTGARIVSNVAAIPAYIWKIAVVVPVGTAPITERITTNTRVIAIKTPNVVSGLSDNWRDYLTSVNQIQQDTGFTFFTALPASTAAVLRTMIDGQPLEGAPMITQNPAPQSVTLGGTATFSATATGNEPLNYQWSFEGQELSGATSATLTLTNVQLADMGHYRVTVTNDVSIATSEAALLVVTGVAPSFLSDPVSQTVNAGSNVVFTSLAAGSPTMSYQWRRNGQPIDGATAATLTLNNVQAANAGNYDVVATNDDGSATSAAAALTVTPIAPVITVQPAPRSVGLNGTATFTVGVTGTEPFTYQWRKDGAEIPDNVSASTATLVLPSVSASTLGSYDVVITNSLGSVTSDAAALTISSFTNGALNYTGGSYTQDFDSLPATQGTEITLSGNGPHALHAAPLNATGLEGWFLAKHGGTGSNALFKVDNGAQFFSGAIYSYGASGSSDRALGSLASGTTQSRFGFALNNNTGQTLTQFTISYVGEQWREGSGAANTLTFSYAIDPTDLNTGNYVSAPTLNFTSPINGTTDVNGLVLDGNAPANRRAISATVTGVVWPAGSRLIVRWTDVDDLSPDDALAIDDFVFTAVNAGPVAPVVLSTVPADLATGVSPSAPISVTFNQPVTLAADWFTLTSAAQGALSATVTGGPTSYTITPTATLPFSDTITVVIRGDRVTDQSSGTLTLGEDYDFEFTTVTPVAPTITTQPASQSVAVGSNVTFTVAASGTAPFTYVWKKGTETIANATGATLTLNNVQLADAGNYSVVVSNSVGSATSNTATLTVSVVTSGVINWNFTGGGTGTASPASALPVGLSGGTVVQGNSFGATTMITTTSASSGYTGASGTYNAAQTARIGSLVQGANGSAYFEVTFTAAAGTRAYFSGLGFGSRSTGTGPKAYALYSSIDNFVTPVASGTMLANSAWAYHSPAFTGIAGPVGGVITFRLYGFGNDGTTSPTSGTANWRIDDLALTVGMQSAPSITAQPAPQNAAVGGSASFSVTATGTEPLSYQWRFNGSPITGATSSTLTLSNVQLTAAGNYDVVVTNPVSSVTSNAVALTVEAPPAGGFAGWRSEHFTSAELQDPAISGPNAVLSADGLTNLMKYALGLSPRVVATDLPGVTAASSELIFSYTRPADRADVSYSVQVSTDLVNWTTSGVLHEFVNSANGNETWRAAYPAGARVFFRLRVEQQP